MKTILIVENEPKRAGFLKDFLELAGYNPVQAQNTKEAIQKMMIGNINGVILSKDLGDEAYTLCSRIRKAVDIPIMFIAEKAEDMEIVRGLGSGADDFLVKPFTGTVLVAHLKANLDEYDRLKVNPKAAAEENGIKFGDMTIRPKSQDVKINGKALTLTKKEFALLYFLAMHPEKIFTKEELYKEIWNNSPMGESSTVTVHVQKIRNKLKKANSQEADCIETVWGTGYRFHVK